MNCDYCSSPMNYGDPKCPGCKRYKVDAIGSGSAGSTVGEEQFVSLADVTTAAIARIVTGGPWDAAFGGGVVPTSTILFGGPPGMGKTTCTIQIASLIAAIAVAEKKDTYAYLISGEMSPPEVRGMTDRIGIPNLDRFRVVSSFSTGTMASNEALKKFPPCCFVVDSISDICGKNTEQQVIVAKEYKKVAVAMNAPVFLISHMSKEGDYAGGLKLQHAVDTLVTLEGADSVMFDMDHAALEGQHDETLQQLRVLRTWKNRFGPSNKPHYLIMTPHGFAALPEVEKKTKKGKKMVQVPLLGVASTQPEQKKDSTIIPPSSEVAVKEGAAFKPRKVRTVDAQEINDDAQIRNNVVGEIEHNGQKLVKKTKDAKKKVDKGTVDTSDLAKKVGGEAVKKKREPMPKTGAKKRKAKERGAWA